MLSCYDLLCKLYSAHEDDVDDEVDDDDDDDDCDAGDDDCDCEKSYDVAMTMMHSFDSRTASLIECNFATTTIDTLNSVNDSVVVVVDDDVDDVMTN